MKLYAITDRRSLDQETIENFIARVVASEIDMLQIREKDMSDNKLFSLVRKSVELAQASRTAIIVNDRLDIALAAGAKGVHLGGHSAPVKAVRKRAPQGFLIGVSTHSRKEASSAAEGGADFITFGPIFATPSKQKYGPPLGLAALEKICEENSVPVYPLGGISDAGYQELFDFPIAGIAGISLFQNSKKLDNIVSVFKSGNN